MAQTYNLPDAATAEAMLKGSTPLSDISRMIFDNLFGQGWDNIFASSGGASGPWTVFFQVLAYYNAVTLSLLAITLLYLSFAWVAGTSHEGVPLGTRYHTWWTPVRSAFSVAMLMPWPGVGISVGQGLILMLLSLSIDAANYVTDKAINYMNTDPGAMTTLAGEINGKGNADKLLTDIMDAAVTQVYLSREVSKGSLTYAAPELDIHWEETGVMNSMKQEIKDFITPYYRENGAVTVGPDHGGAWVITFKVPQPAQALIDNIGTISVPCKTDGSSYCQARLNAVKNLINDIYPIARGIVQGAAIDRDLLVRARHKYIQAYKQAISDYVQNKGAAEFQKAVGDFHNVVDNGGWVMLFSWYWNMAGKLEKLHDMTQAMTTTSEGPDPNALAGAIEEDFNGYTQAAARYRSYSLKTDIERISESEDMSVLEKGMSYPFVLITDAVSGWLMEGDPVINLKTMGDYIIGSVNVMIAGYVGKEVLSGLANMVMKAFAYRAGGPAAAAAAGGVSAKIGEKAGKALSFFGVLLTTIIIPLFILGAFLAYYLPSIPFLLGMIAVVGWIILVVETLFAYPAWIYAHALEQGEGLAGQRAAPGYMLFTNIAIRPVLMVGAFFFAFFSIRVVSWLVGVCWLVFHHGLQASSMTGPVTAIVLLFIIGTLMVVIIDRIFGLVTYIPENVLRWIGGGGTNLGEESMLSHARSTIMAGVLNVRNDGMSSAGSLAKNIKNLGGKKGGKGGKGVSLDTGVKGG